LNESVIATIHNGTNAQLDMCEPTSTSRKDCMPGAGFGGLRVLALESRHAKEMVKLIASYGGVLLAIM
jgi:hypothetical protein